MSINSSVQQLGGGIASVIGGWIIGQNAEGLLVHYDILGWVTIGAFFVCAVLMYGVNSYIMSKTAEAESRKGRGPETRVGPAISRESRSRLRGG
ncbi:hypothetical protein ACQ86N_34495 [Puia sp. P3]|uniref:hypothetical protein n=1 Tax=Puia sp. P3 TaxID=3423952 RepID=UPI003D66D754